MSIKYPKHIRPSCITLLSLLPDVYNYTLILIAMLIIAVIHQHTRKLISAGKTLHKYSDKDLSRLR